MKTGCFKYLSKNKLKGCISISLFSSGNEQVKYEYKALVPNYKDFKLLKEKKISEAQFIENFKNNLSSLNAEVVYSDLKSLVQGEEPILMTDGNKTNFCHRHLVAEWFFDEISLEIDEVTVGKVIRSDGYMKKINNPTLF